MAKKDDKKKETPAEELTLEEETSAPEAAEAQPEEAPEAAPAEAPAVDWEAKYNAEHDAHLRLAAEYDNFRKRTIKEKEASYGNGKSDAVLKMLPVYDNLERALKQETQDTAYKRAWSSP